MEFKTIRNLKAVIFDEVGDKMKILRSNLKY